MFCTLRPQAFKAENTNEPVMITHDPSWQFRIGKAKMLSFKDIKIVNLMYNCSGEWSYTKHEKFLEKN